MHIIVSWYIYSEEVRALGGVVNNAGTINTPGWDVYKTSVADGTFFGAYITGSGGGKSNVLEKVPATADSAGVKVTATADSAGLPGPWPTNLPVPWPPGFTSLHHGLKCDPSSSDAKGKEAKDL
eukprot:s459_g29.t1